MLWFRLLLLLIFASTRQLGAAQQLEAASMTVTEQQAASREALADRRVRILLGEGEPTVVSTDAIVDKVQAEAFLAGNKPEPPARQASVLFWNRKTGKAARALVALPKGGVLEAVPVNVRDVPVIKEEVQEALDLAKADSSFRRAAGVDVSRFRVAEPGSTSAESYVAQALPLRGTESSDPCTQDRCLDLIFRVENGYLPVRAHIDLTRRQVQLEGSKDRGTHHE
jgi:hypothetical protein